MEYLCHKWPRICSVCRKHFPVLSSYMIYHRVCNYINTTGATSGAGTAYPSGTPEFTPGFVWGSCYSIFSFMCMFCRSLFVLLSSSIYGLWLLLWYFQTLLILLQYTCSCYLFFILSHHILISVCIFGLFLYSNNITFFKRCTHKTFIFYHLNI